MLINLYFIYHRIERKISFILFYFLGGDSTLEIQDLKSQLEECEGRLEKGAEYVDYLQAQQEEMAAEIAMLKKELTYDDK